MRIKKSFILATAAVLALSVVAGCSGEAEKAAPATTTTTSTTLAIALPADQVSMQGRGTLTLDELGVGWTLDPTQVNDLGPLEETGGNCNGPNLKARMLGNIGSSTYTYVKSPEGSTDFTIFTYVFPTVDAAKASFARTIASYACNSWQDPKTGESNTLSVLPNLTSGDEFIARRISSKVGERYCNVNQILSVADILEVRIGAQVFRYVLATDQNSKKGCDGNYPDAAPPDTAQLFLLAQQAIDKYNAELKQYTKEVYAALATTTSTTKPKKDSSE